MQPLAKQAMRRCECRYRTTQTELAATAVGLVDFSWSS
jgi:hypothetical protein